MKYIVFLFIILFGGCSIHNYEHTQSKLIVIKSPKLRFADIGYLRNSGKSIELELFVAGQAVEKISVNHLICTREGCMSRSGFNEEYLSSAYPADMMQNLLLGQAIFDGKNLVKTADGFWQEITTQDVQITYKVSSHAVIFKDKKNNILFKLKDSEF